MSREAGKGDKWRKTDWDRYWEADYWEALAERKRKEKEEQDRKDKQEDEAP